MDITTIVVYLIGGIGIGSVITTIITTLSRKREILNERVYKEKRGAYLGLLRSLHNAAVEPSDKNAKEYALWQTRIQLFGSKESADFAQKIVDTAPGSSARNLAFEGLLKAMRDDLKSCK
ncbi:MAG TPA: hypothetical protein DHW79_02525 [Candidatus Cloacimonas sp.]|nr:hypothetical protein [Candidatus Cloacimonas sp.]